MSTPRRGRTFDAARKRTPWCVFDTEIGRTHVDLPLVTTQREAERELADLLRYHAAESGWRRRLEVRRGNAP